MVTQTQFVRRKWGVRVGCLLAALVILITETATAQSVETLGIELYVRPDSTQCQQAEAFLADLAERRQGIAYRVIDVTKDKQGLARLWTLTKRFGRDEAKLPSIYMTDRLWVGFGPQTGASLEAGLTIDAYVRPGCPHCRDAKRFLDRMAPRWPALSIRYHDVTASREALREANSLARKHQIRAVSFPVIHAAGRVQVGFGTAATSGSRLEAPFRSPAVEKRDRSAAAPRRASSQLAVTPYLLPHWLMGTVVWQTEAPPEEAQPPPDNAGLLPAESPAEQPETKQSAIPEESPIPQDLPIPREAEIHGEAEIPGEAGLPVEGGVPGEALLPERSTTTAGDAASDSPVIRVELLGKERAIRVEDYGLPAFTIVIGLIDGFNPCAMWVLIFLLSILVNIRDRKKILAIAGVFVLVSGLAYFSFMAAWLSVFSFVGLMRPVQIGLGLLALFIGIVNVKDFFAFHQGLSLSIPKSARPKLYRRMQNIVKANYLGAAVAGAVVLAVIVNVIELLCTAGLPALYTQILTLHQLSPAANYGYLGLYILAYMADDTMMIGIALVTLSNRRMQETEGRWLKLLSGVVILLLGGVMLFRPEWLMLA